MTLLLLIALSVRVELGSIDLHVVVHLVSLGFYDAVICTLVLPIANKPVDLVFKNNSDMN